MGFSGGARATVGVALGAAAVIVLSSCGGSSPSPPRDPSTGTPPQTPTVPGATVVSGTERLAWTQSGDVSNLRFRAYVDGAAVALETVRCDGAPDAECSAPLPPLTTGVHAIALVAVSSAGVESQRSEAITVQKVAARSVISAASFPDARASSTGTRLESTVSVSGGATFAADVVARALASPLQLASAPDGRLLVAGADGLVRVVRPGEPERDAIALDATALLAPPPAGPLGLALHPDFAQNHFVYVSFLAEDVPGRMVLRIVRLREAGDALGEPATIFEAPVTRSIAATRTGDVGRADATVDGPEDGPRLAFGPDGLLYALLPPGREFDHEPAASRPHASMLRLQDDGRTPQAGALSGITAHPLGFTWHPATGVLWMIFPGEDGAAAVRPVTGGGDSGTDEPGLSVLRMTEGRVFSSGALTLDARPASVVGWSGVLAPGLDYNVAGVARLVVPILAEGLLTGISGRIADVVAAGGGTWYLATSGTGATSGTAARDGDVVMRLRLRDPQDAPQ